MFKTVVPWAGGGGLHFVFRKSERKKKLKRKEGSVYTRLSVIVYFRHIFTYIASLFDVHWTVLGFSLSGWD